MFLARSRPLFILAFLASILVMSAALYLDYGLGLMPCPLCLAQRFFLMVFAAICLAAAVHAPRRSGWRVYSALALSNAFLGALVAARQIWWQGSLQAPQDGSYTGLGDMLQAMPWGQVLNALLLGTPDCARVNWTLLELSIPEWSLLAFAALIVFALTQLLRRG